MIESGLLSQTRVGRFTASNIADLLTQPRTLTAEQKARKAEGVPVFGSTAMSLIAEKAWERLAGQWNAGPMSRATERGSELEAVAFALLDKHWKPMQKSYVDGGFMPYGDNSGATPDALTENGSETVDIKCPWNGNKLLAFAMVSDMDLDALMAWDKTYYWQIQMQMLAAGAEAGWLIYFDDRLTVLDLDDEDRANFMDDPITQFNPVRPGFCYVARRFPLQKDAKLIIDRVLAAAEAQCLQIMEQFAARL